MERCCDCCRRPLPEEFFEPWKDSWEQDTPMAKSLAAMEALIGGWLGQPVTPPVPEDRVAEISDRIDAAIERVALAQGVHPAQLERELFLWLDNEPPFGSDEAERIARRIAEQWETTGHRGTAAEFRQAVFDQAPDQPQKWSVVVRATTQVMAARGQNSQVDRV